MLIIFSDCKWQKPKKKIYREIRVISFLSWQSLDTRGNFLYTHSNHIWSLALSSCFKCSDDKLWNLLNRSWGRGWGFVLGWVSGLIRPYIEHVFLLEVVVVCHPLTISFLKLRGILSPGNIEWNMCSIFRNLF